ncbi:MULTISPECIES: CpXC domain-containing protein [unclassified Breznakia]|uniref:CpXC domain-containing protein n=1 Tax=unclassified Breznakia TaxID=2623764 RepID=UPI0024058834|nr:MULTISPECIES: CpXC domain-containing protein [unclassified Breznakia]MDF9838259.1 hypothetical protein [Breznakia sp. PFB2-8]MDF9860275.1 hypothetical protein [Breznakia sp. PH5-24]
MNTRIFEIECSNCNHTWFVKTDTIFHDHIHKQIKFAFYDGSFFKRKCSNCGELIDFKCPLVYYFTDKNTLICLGCEAHNEQAKSYNVSSIGEFVENLKIIDYGCTMEEIIALKKKLINYDKLIFDSFADNCYFFQTRDGIIAIEKIVKVR